jgi:hypothetical protein
MREIERIGKQIDKTFGGRAWHGPAVEEVLKDVDAKLASAPSPGGAHNIWQIVEHLIIWQDAVGRWLAGDTKRPKDEESWPAITDTSEAAWQATLKRLRTSHRALTKEVAKLDDARLDQRVFEGMPTVYVTLHGIIQHNLYHAGQIATLKKIGCRL